jgi:hypothetical protein
MAERLADVVAQIQNVRQLEAVVTAMRGIAASRAQQGRSLLAGDPPPLKWSDLRYVFDIQEDCNGKEAIQA